MSSTQCDLFVRTQILSFFSSGSRLSSVQDRARFRLDRFIQQQLQTKSVIAISDEL
jgi:hypothetical protein